MNRSKPLRQAGKFGFHQTRSIVSFVCKYPRRRLQPWQDSGRGPMGTWITAVTRTEWQGLDAPGSRSAESLTPERLNATTGSIGRHSRPNRKTIRKGTPSGCLSRPQALHSERGARPQGPAAHRAFRCSASATAWRARTPLCRRSAPRRNCPENEGILRV